MDARTRAQIHAIDVVCAHPQIERVSALRCAPAAPGAGDKAIPPRALLFGGARGRGQHERQDDSTEQAHVRLSETRVLSRTLLQAQRRRKAARPCWKSQL